MDLLDGSRVLAYLPFSSWNASSKFGIFRSVYCFRFLPTRSWHPARVTTEHDFFFFFSLFSWLQRQKRTYVAQTAQETSARYRVLGRDADRELGPLAQVALRPLHLVLECLHGPLKKQVVLYFRPYLLIRYALLQSTTCKIRQFWYGFPETLSSFTRLNKECLPAPAYTAAAKPFQASDRVCSPARSSICASCRSEPSPAMRSVPENDWFNN